MTPPLALALVVGVLLSACTTTTPSPSSNPTSSAPPSAAAVATVAPAQTPVPPATITGRLGYPSDFVPPLTVYAINVEDQNVWYSASTPRFGNPLSSIPPGPTWPPSGPGRYAISLPPGTYYVIAYRDDVSPLSNAPDAHTLYAAKCASSDPAVPSPAPGPCPYDHRLAPIAVTPGQIVEHVDLVDWLFNGGTYPPRPTPPANVAADVAIEGRSYRISAASPAGATVLWRDFMPVSPPDGRPLVASIRVESADGAPFPQDITVDHVWVYGPSTWETAPTEVRRSPEAGTPPSQLEVVARDGPKWNPGTKVDAVIRLRSKTGIYFLRLAGITIERTS